ncbi:MAG: hypothetical protein U0263_38855 [Polyangiaceae bacterium]
MELVVVVIIVGVLAALAIPTITGQMRSRRTAFVAKEIVSLYRGARMRAMGRGSAVLVRFDRGTDAQGRFEVREAVRTAQVSNTNCNGLPVSNCTLTTWTADNADSQVIGQLIIANRAELEGINARVRDPGDGDHTQMDVCFTPMGRAFMRYGLNNPLTPLTTIPRVKVARVNAITQDPYGPSRWVLVVPNGAARLGIATEETTL